MDPDFNKLTATQQYLHGLKMTDGKYLIREDDLPVSLMGSENEKFNYYSPIHEKASIEALEQGNIRYKANMKHHRIFAVEYRQSWPDVRVQNKHKGKVQICWTHNRGTNCFTKTALNVGTQFITSLDNAGIDVLNVVCRSKNQKDFQKKMGNVESAEEWTDYLESDVTNPFIPWWFSRNTGSFLPLFLFSPEVISFDFELRNKIYELLRMREKKDDGSWYELTRKEIEDRGLNYLEPLKESLKPADFVIYYVDSLKDEIDRVLNAAECHRNDQVYNIEYPFEEMIVADADNDYRFGMDQTITPEVEFASKYTMGLGKNLTAEDKNLYSNYTSNDTDVYRGGWPIPLIKWQGPGNKSVDFDLLTVQGYINMLLKKAPITNGYFFMPKSIRPDDIDDKNGVSYRNNQIKFKFFLADTGSKKDIKNNNNFKMLTRSLVCRTFTFGYDFAKKRFIPNIDSQI